MKKILVLFLVLGLFAPYGAYAQQPERRVPESRGNATLPVEEMRGFQARTLEERRVSDNDNDTQEEAELHSRGHEMRARAHELRDRRMELREKRQEMAQQRKLQMSERVRERLEERTQERAERLADRVNSINERMTDVYLARIERLRNILERMENRIANIEETADTSFVDVGEFMENAYEALLDAEEMVLNQAEKVYVVEVEMPNELGQGLRLALAELRGDLRNLRDEAMRPAREAVVSVFREFRAAPSEDNNQEE